MTRSWKSPMPSVGEILATLKAAPDAAELCIQASTGEVHEPREVWIESIGVWCRTDGSLYSADFARGFARPSLINRWRLRRAIKISLDPERRLKRAVEGLPGYRKLGLFDWLCLIALFLIGAWRGGWLT